MLNAGTTQPTTQPLGKITLLVTFGTKDNYCMENVTFIVADILLPYNVS
jgi:hypothetical protein